MMIAGAVHISAVVLPMELQKDIILTVDVRLNALVRQNTPSIDINLITNRHIVAQHTDILQSRPFPDTAVPAHNCALDPRMVFDLGVGQKDGSLDPYTVTDDYVGTDGDVGTDAAIFADFGGRVDEDVAAVDEGFRMFSEFLAALLGEGGEVKAGA